MPHWRDALTRQPAWQAVLDDIHRYFEQYGHQIYTLDFVRPTQGEDPLPVLLNLKSLVGRTKYDIRARQATFVEERDTQITATVGFLGPLRRWVFQKLLGWAQCYGPHRDRRIVLSGRRLADAQALGPRAWGTPRRGQHPLACSTSRAENW